jgi:hypothetical protein
VNAKLGARIFARRRNTIYLGFGRQLSTASVISVFR